MLKTSSRNIRQTRLQSPTPQSAATSTANPVLANKLGSSVSSSRQSAGAKAVIRPTKTANRQKQIGELATQKVQALIDQLTGGKWAGSYEDSVYDVASKGGLWDYKMDPQRISFKFTARQKGDATFVADRIINYDSKDYKEQFIGSVSPDGKVVMNSIADSDVLSGQLDAKSGTLTLLFFDDGKDSSSLGSQTAVGTYVFSDLSKPYSALPSWA